MPDTYYPYTLVLAAAMRGTPLKLGHLTPWGWRQLLDAARYHGVAPLIHQHVASGQLTGLPSAAKELLTGISRSHAVQDLLLNLATRQMLDLLALNGYPALVLKGTAIACSYFGDSYLRPRCDTDLYIREQDRRAVATLLGESGYTIAGFDSRKYASKQFGASLAGQRAARANFDIHWKLSNRALFLNTLPFEECWEARQPLPTLGEHAFTLSAAHLLLHVCIHRIAHGRNSDRNRLIWLHDIHLITRRFSQGDFNQFFELATAKGIGALCADGLIMAQYYFGTTYPPAYVGALAQNRAREPAARLINGGKLRWGWADVKATRGIEAKLGLVHELLFPSHLGQHGWLRRLRSKLIG